MKRIVLAVIAYAVTGGLEAAFITDTIQGIFIIKFRSGVWRRTIPCCLNTAVARPRLGRS